MVAVPSSRPYETAKARRYVAATVFLTCLVLLGRCSAAALMLCVMALIDVILIGALHWIGEYCNMITAVILTLAIGLAVDFSAHVTHASLCRRRRRRRDGPEE